MSVVFAKPRSMVKVGRCECCSEMARVVDNLCSSCVAEYGERMAQLIARARVEAGFADACAARMSPAARRSFTQALAGRTGRTPGLPRKVYGRGTQSRTTGRAHLRSCVDLSRK